MRWIDCSPHLITSPLCLARSRSQSTFRCPENMPLPLISSSSPVCSPVRRNNVIIDHDDAVAATTPGGHTPQYHKTRKKKQQHAQVVYTLKRLSLNRMGWDDEAIVALADTLARPACTLIRLELGGNGIGLPGLCKLGWAVPTASCCAANQIRVRLKIIGNSEAMHDSYLPNF